MWEITRRTHRTQASLVLRAYNHVSKGERHTEQSLEKFTYRLPMFSPPTEWGQADMLPSPAVRYINTCVVSLSRQVRVRFLVEGI